MPKHDVRLAAMERDTGIRKVNRWTWWASAFGAACSVLIGVGLSHAAASTAASTNTSHPTRQQAHQQDRPRKHRAKHPGGGIIIPAQPPQQSSGGGQVTSGSS